jgi:uncharacterized membrane protein (UPF0127 family)
MEKTAKVKFSVKGKKYQIKAKILESFFSKVLGLMFKTEQNAQPVLLVFPDTQLISIHSFFCVPFKAVFLDDKFHAVKVKNVSPWTFLVSAKARYLLEIPKTSTDVTKK